MLGVGAGEKRGWGYGVCGEIRVGGWGVDGLSKLKFPKFEKCHFLRFP
jgi:hypothetical protein